MHYLLIICCTLKLIFSVGCSPHVPRDLSYYLDPYEDAKDINAARNLEEATSYSKKLVTPKVGSIFDGEFLQGFLVLDKDKGSGEVKAALEGKFLFISFIDIDAIEISKFIRNNTVS